MEPSVLYIIQHAMLKVENEIIVKYNVIIRILNYALFFCCNDNTKEETLCSFFAVFRSGLKLICTAYIISYILYYWDVRFDRYWVFK